jgi:hypothetical protein
MADSGNGLRDEPQQPVAPPAPAAEEKVTLTRAEFDAMKRESAEARESERYWATQARGSNGRPAEPTVQLQDDGPDASEFIDPDEQPQGIEGDTPEKLIDEFAASGVAALSKRGFITAKDAQKIAVDTALRVTQELIGRERQKMGTDAQIKQEFPDLWDQNSDLFKETAKHYQKAVAMDPNATKSPAALYLAAEAARASLGRRTPAREDHEYEERGREREDDRRARATAQDNRPNGKQQVDDMDMLGPEAKEVARLMGISVKEFQDSRKELGTRARRR